MERVTRSARPSSSYQNVPRLFNSENQPKRTSMSSLQSLTIRGIVLNREEGVLTDVKKREVSTCQQYETLAFSRAVLQVCIFIQQPSFLPPISCCSPQIHS